MPACHRIDVDRRVCISSAHLASCLQQGWQGGLVVVSQHMCTGQQHSSAQHSMAQQRSGGHRAVCVSDGRAVVCNEEGGRVLSTNGRSCSCLLLCNEAQATALGDCCTVAGGDVLAASCCLCTETGWCGHRARGQCALLGVSSYMMQLSPPKYNGTWTTSRPVQHANHFSRLQA